MERCSKRTFSSWADILSRSQVLALVRTTCRERHHEIVGDVERVHYLIRFLSARPGLANRQLQSEGESINVPSLNEREYPLKPSYTAERVEAVIICPPPVRFPANLLELIWGVWGNDLGAQSSSICAVRFFGQDWSLIPKLADS